MMAETKTIKGYIEQQEMDNWGSGLGNLVCVWRWGNVVERDNRVPVTVTVDSVMETTVSPGHWDKGTGDGKPVGGTGETSAPWKCPDCRREWFCYKWCPICNSYQQAK